MWSSLCPSLIFVTLRFFGISHIASICGASMILFENDMIIEGKFVLTDGIFHSFVCLSLTSISYFFSVYPYTKKWEISYIFVCIISSLAASIKQTAWSLLPIVYLTCIIRMYLHLISQTNLEIDSRIINAVILKGVELLMIFALTYIFIFIVHIKMLPNFGPGSYKVCSGVVENYKDKIGEWNKCKNRNIIYHVLDLMKKINDINMGIQGGDSKDITSKWHEWPLMHHMLICFYYSEERKIFLTLNRVNSYIILFTLSYSTFIFYKAYFSENIYLSFTMPCSVYLISFLGYLASFIPFYFVPRPTYAYHYIIPIIFGVICVSSFLDLVLIKYKKTQIIISLLIISASFCWYLVYSPWTYGLPTKYHMKKNG